MDPVEQGYLLFEVTEGGLLEGIKTAGTNDTVWDSTAREVLERVGLIAVGAPGADVRLTDAGRSIYRAAFVLRDTAASRRMLGQALRGLLPLQVLSQELGHGEAIPEEGVLGLWALHRVVDPDFTVQMARPTFRWLNAAGVVVYSSKLKTIRFVPDDPGAAKAGEVPMLSAMVSPRTPFSNVARLRRLLRTQTGVVVWADQHFGARAFEELVDELDAARVSEFRIISGGGEGVLSPKSYRDYVRFREEMSNKGIAVEWRVDTSREWHDRWLVDDLGAFNMPPVNSLFANQYSEMLPSAEPVPVGEWWSRAVARES